jgi:hypothetical protein
MPVKLYKNFRREFVKVIDGQEFVYKGRNKLKSLAYWVEPVVGGKR